MKKKIINFILILILSVLCLSSCLGPNTVLVYIDEVKESLKNDYGITIEKEYGQVYLTKHIKDYTQFNDFNDIDEKLSKWTNNISALYIKTDKGEDKFVYYPTSIAKKSIKENGKTIVAEIKDYIYVSDFPFFYTYDDIYIQCSEIMDDHIRREVLSAFNNKNWDGVYYAIYPERSAFRDFTDEEAALINSHLVDKELVFTIDNYYFFYIRENGADMLYIYKQVRTEIGSQIIYTSSQAAPSTPMTKDMFINYLKRL